MRESLRLKYSQNWFNVRTGTPSHSRGNKSGNTQQGTTANLRPLLKDMSTMGSVASSGCKPTTREAWLRSSAWSVTPSRKFRWSNSSATWLKRSLPVLRSTRRCQLLSSPPRRRRGSTRVQGTLWSTDSFHVRSPRPPATSNTPDPPERPSPYCSRSHKAKRSARCDFAALSPWSASPLYTNRSLSTTAFDLLRASSNSAARDASSTLAKW
mmetsp:Transcript_58803/g.156489  ORF Transcript_58803/g.156489 Transcript_58803/m.156489 type:complete len:211 (+) Transcript_58803:688-1320(+)